MPDDGSPPPAGRSDPRSSHGAHRHPHLLVQAPVAPFDVDGLRVVGIGTVGFAVAALLAVLFADELRAAGREWWTGVCVAGFVLGLVGLAYCARLRTRRLRG